MDEESGHEGAGHEVHLPDPSPWPIVAGFAALLLGAALVWWARDTGNEVAAVALGAAAVVALISVGGWAYEDGRMRMKAEGAAHGPREARYTQVLTFAIAEGQLDTARGPVGVVTAIDARDNALRDLAGFQDLRIVVSAADVGPSQVLVETTWSDREGLATYEETRSTLLDLVNEHSEEVVPGSVQVFDMEVVRDTKDVSVRFGLGTASVLIGSLIVGGFFVGAGLTLFEGEGTGGEGGGNGGNGGGPTGFQQTGVMVARNILFVDEQISLPPGQEFTMTLDNQDNGTPHNIIFFEGTTAGEGPILGGCTEGCAGEGDEVRSQDTMGPEQTSFTFTTPDAGEYAFWCSFHPTTMVGTLTVEDGVPLPGGGGDGGGNGGEVPSGGTTITAQNLEFGTTEFTVASGSEVTVTLDNQDSAPHNIVFFQGSTAGEGDPLTGCTAGCEGDAVQTPPLVPAGESATITFTAPAAGDYAFQCTLHPQMVGVMHVQ